MEDFVHVTGLERRFEGGRAVQSFDLSIYHDGDTVAILRLVHIVGGDKDRNTPFGSLVDQLPELAAGDRIDTSGRFIQENDPRFVDDGDGESQLLLPAQRQGIDQCVSFVLQSKDPEQISKPATFPTPEVGVKRPHSIRMAVVLPAPFAPKKPKSSPSPTVKLMWSTAVKGPKHFVSLSVSITFIFYIFLIHARSSDEASKTPEPPSGLRTGLSKLLNHRPNSGQDLSCFRAP